VGRLGKFSGFGSANKPFHPGSGQKWFAANVDDAINPAESPPPPEREGRSPKLLGKGVEGNERRILRRIT
jgi:hypothetical protein